MPSDLRARFGSFEADFATGELFKNGTTLPLQEKPFEILSLLLQARGQLVTREEITSKVWPGVFVESSFCLNTAIRRLRAVLEKADPKAQLIETVGRRGYRLHADVKFSPLLSASVSHADHRPRLAVLPFENLNNGAPDHFADGLSAQMIVQLGRLCKGMSIVAPVSSLHFKGTTKSLQQIARELHVDYLLEGSVWRVPPRLRITARLTRTSDESCVWSESYARDDTEIFQLQDEITRAISRGLLQALPEPTMLPDSSTTLPTVYETYLKARFLSFKFVQTSFQTAIQLFEQVITEDPNFAPAYAALAQMLTAAVAYGGPPHRVFYRRIENLATKALQSSERLPEAHCALGWLRCWQANWALAEKEFSRALEINPNFSLGYAGYACLLSSLGRHEQAIAAGKRACQLDPLSPLVHTMMGIQLYFFEQFTEAIECQHRAIEIDPGFCPAHAMLGFLHQEMGELDRAVHSLRVATEQAPDTPLMRCFLARTLAAAGETEDARAILREMLELRHTNCLPATSIALIYAALGQREEAWSCLMTAMRELDPWRCSMAVDPRFRFFWNDPRFLGLLHQMGLPSPPSSAPLHHSLVA